MRSGFGRWHFREHSNFRHFCRFQKPRALATHEDPTKASRPFDIARNGIVVAEGGCVYILERLSDAKRRKR